jgi:cellulose synthase/poly-beta-1,6-N-acetylglucosamine synthase-like glycosyltransferase
VWTLTYIRSLRQRFSDTGIICTSQHHCILLTLLRTSPGLPLDQPNSLPLCAASLCSVFFSQRLRKLNRCCDALSQSDFPIDRTSRRKLPNSRNNQRRIGTRWVGDLLRVMDYDFFALSTSFLTTFSWQLSPYDFGLFLVYSPDYIILLAT